MNTNTKIKMLILATISALILLFAFGGSKVHAAEFDFNSSFDWETTEISFDDLPQLEDFENKFIKENKIFKFDEFMKSNDFIKIPNNSFWNWVYPNYQKGYLVLIGNDNKSLFIGYQNVTGENYIYSTPLKGAEEALEYSNLPDYYKINNPEGELIYSNVVSTLGEIIKRSKNSQRPFDNLCVEYSLSAISTKIFYFNEFHQEFRGNKIGARLQMVNGKLFYHIPKFMIK